MPPLTSHSLINPLLDTVTKSLSRRTVLKDSLKCLCLYIREVT